MITNAASGTNLHEIAAGIYRINTPLALPDGSGFSFNQYLIADDEPLLFHTGARGLFPLVAEKGFPPFWYGVAFAVFGLTVGVLAATRSRPAR